VTGILSTGPGKAVVMTSSGKEMTADLVIGSDGIRSVVRHELFGEKQPKFFGRVTNRMILLDLAPFLKKPDFDELFSRPLQNLWMGPGGSALTHPIRAGTGAYIGVTTSGLAEEEGFWSQRVDNKWLLEKFAGWDPRLLQLVEASPDATGYGLYDSEPLPSWSIGRVCLLGDACHAMLPFQSQGAAQSIEDGAVLANLLTGAGSSDVEAAIARYVAIRKPRSIRVQEASRANGNSWQLPEGPEQAKRDAEFAKTGGDFVSYGWLWTVGGDGGAPVMGPAAQAA
jgi:salicylate hydroxylase